jgi:hypothetical protein
VKLTKWESPSVHIACESRISSLHIAWESRSVLKKDLLIASPHRPPIARTPLKEMPGRKCFEGNALKESWLLRWTDCWGDAISRSFLRTLRDSHAMWRLEIRDSHAMCTLGDSHFVSFTEIISNEDEYVYKYTHL